MTAEPTTTVASLANVLRHIASEIDNFMPEPSALTYYTYEHRPPIITLTFDIEGAACVETWAAKYGSHYGSLRQPRGETQWLTTDMTELMGVTLTLTGYDPREPDPDPVATQPQPAVDWLLYDTCHRPKCQAAAGQPCVHPNGVPLAGRAHKDRPLIGPAPEVWDGSVPPGGFVCSVCRTPVESEPCPEHGEKVTDGPTEYPDCHWIGGCREPLVPPSLLCAEHDRQTDGQYA